jgi:hypothetical protein
VPAAVYKRTTTASGRVRRLDKTHCCAEYDSKRITGSCFPSSEQKVGTRLGRNLVDLHLESEFRAERLPLLEKDAGRWRR